MFLALALLPGLAAASSLAAVAIPTGPKPSPSPPPSLFWGLDAPFGDNAVLQRAPAAAAIYGYLDTPAATGVTVTVWSGGAPLYSVDAVFNVTLQPFGDGWGARPCPKAACPPYDMDLFTPFAYPLPTWKALLRPTPAGGNYTITAVCTGCLSNATLSMGNVVFGDIWVCSGQSNAMLWVSNTFARNESALNYSQGLNNGANIRIMGGQDTIQPYASWPPAYGSGAKASNPWMTSEQAVPAGCIDKQNCPLFRNSGACWYALQTAAAQGVDVPMGLVALTLGGQRIEEFMSNVTGPTGPYVCENLNSQTIPWWNGASVFFLPPPRAPFQFSLLFAPLSRFAGQLYGVYLMPFVDFSVKGWLWYRAFFSIFFRASPRRPASLSPFIPSPPSNISQRARTTWAGSRATSSPTRATRAPCGSSLRAGARPGPRRLAPRTPLRLSASSRSPPRAARAAPTLARCASRRR